jgi:hypothetical protein
LKLERNVLGESSVDLLVDPMLEQIVFEWWIYEVPKSKCALFASMEAVAVVHSAVVVRLTAPCWTSTRGVLHACAQSVSMMILTACCLLSLTAVASLKTVGTAYPGLSGS